MPAPYRTVAVEHDTHGDLVIHVAVRADAQPQPAQITALTGAPGTDDQDQADTDQADTDQADQ